MNEIVDLRDGFRVEVEPMIIPAGEFGARLYARRKTTPANPSLRGRGRVTWKQVGPRVLAETPESAARDLMDAVNAGLLPGVEASA